MQVRGQPGGQPLYVQMPVTSAATGGQSIQIVRSVDQPVTVRQPQFVTSGPNAAAVQQPQQQLILNSGKAGSQPSLITLSPQQPVPGQPLTQQPQQVVLQANNTVLAAGQQQQQRQVAIQLQEQAAGNLMTAHQQAKAAVNQRMRQQRKQSLK